MKTKIPDFTRISLGKGLPEATLEDWRERFVAETGVTPELRLWHTPEGIDIKPFFTSHDLEGLDHLSTMPGLAPFLRGPYPTMYVESPWTIRQYAGFSTAQASNAFYRRNLAAGQKVFRSRSTSLLTVVTTAIIRAWRAMSEWPALLSIPSWT